MTDPPLAPSPDDRTRTLRLARFQRALFAMTPRIVVTPLLVFANVAVFAWMVVRGVGPLSPDVLALLDWGANYGPRTLAGEPWRLVSSMFIHAGALHLALNMWVLWSAGRMVERLVGNTGLFLLYVISGICGSLGSLWWNPTTPSVGASGAVFGVIGALLGYVVLRRDSIPGELLRGLLQSVGLFIALNVALGLSYERIDMGAHVGGLVAGAGCGLVLSQPVSPEAARRRGVRNLAVVLAGAALVAIGWLGAPPAPGDWLGALRRLEQVEGPVLQRLRSASMQLETGDLSPDGFARMVETEVLPPWREVRVALETLPGLPADRRRLIERLHRMAALREEGWALLAEGVRTGDRGKQRRAQDLEQAARAAAEGLDEDGP